jgi:hypothetical protein
MKTSKSTEVCQILERMSCPKLKRERQKITRSKGDVELGRLRVPWNHMPPRWQKKLRLFREPVMVRKNLLRPSIDESSRLLLRFLGKLFSLFE